MGSAVSGLPAILGASGRAGNAGRWAALQMLDGTNGAARLVFDSGDGRRCKAKLGRWIFISRPQRSAARGPIRVAPGCPHRPLVRRPATRRHPQGRDGTEL